MQNHRKGDFVEGEAFVECVKLCIPLLYMSASVSSEIKKNLTYYEYISETMSIIEPPKISLKKLNEWHFRFSTKLSFLFLLLSQLCCPFYWVTFPLTRTVTTQHLLHPFSHYLHSFISLPWEEKKFTKRPSNIVQWCV